MYLGTAGILSSIIRSRAALILASTGLFYVLSGLTLVDSAFCFAVAVALTTLFLQTYWWWGILFALGITLALLAKGLLAILIIVPTACCWEIFARSHFREKIYSLLKLLAYCALGVAASIPWHIMAEFDTPGFLNYYIIGEHFRRFTEPGWVSMYGSAHIEPHGFIWLFLGLSLLPWVLLVIPVLVKYCRRDYLSNLNFSIKTNSIPISTSVSAPTSIQILVFLLSWALVVPVIFTFSSGIMIPYLLPTLPAWSILLSLFIERYLQISPRRLVCIASIVPAGFIVVALFILPIVGVRRSEVWIKSGLVSQGDRINYIERLPYSAQFYSNGKATNLKGLTTNLLETRLADSIPDIYVVEKKNTRDLTLLRANNSLEQILNNPKNIVFRELLTKQH
jgi:4-amino-4-deoxy-L-arabinose transferase-like glycosyltransferase